MISVRELTKQYGEIRAVSNVSFDVQQGSIVGLLGQNGAGKTTVMKILTGFLEPTSGTVLVGEKDVRTQRTEVQDHIGYMPENAPLYDEMLVQEYLIMMAELRGIANDKLVFAVKEALEVTGLKSRAIQPIGTLSKGYRQRVGLAQAIIHRPEVLVLDEPTNGLDPVQILEIRALIKNLAKTTTVIVSTHILSEIEAVCDRVVILIDGEVAADESLATLLSAQQVEVKFTEVIPDDVKAKLTSLSGVSGVRFNDALSQITLDCSDASSVSREILKSVQDFGWKLEAVYPLTPSLETVFRNLMEQKATTSNVQGAVA